MGNRLGVIILLVVWIGQALVCVSGEVIGLSVFYLVVWRPTENLTELVNDQVSHLMPWPPPGTHSRGKHKRQSGLRPHHLKSPSLEDDEKEDRKSEPAKP